jgi:hypothetical protein
MAVLVIADIKGATVDQYEAVSRAIGFRDPDFQPPAGLISHTAAVDGDGVFIVDVWESADDFQRLMADTAPALQDVGVPPFEPRIYPVRTQTCCCSSTRRASPSTSTSARRSRWMRTATAERAIRPCGTPPA